MICAQANFSTVNNARGTADEVICPIIDFATMNQLLRTRTKEKIPAVTPSTMSTGKKTKKKKKFVHTIVDDDRYNGETAEADLKDIRINNREKFVHHCDPSFVLFLLTREKTS